MLECLLDGKGLGSRSAKLDVAAQLQGTDVSVEVINNWSFLHLKALFEDGLLEPETPDPRATLYEP